MMWKQVALESFCFFVSPSSENTEALLRIIAATGDEVLCFQIMEIFLSVTNIKI